MRRLLISAMVLTGIVATAAVLGTDFRVSGQSQSAELGSHPLVGSWVVTATDETGGQLQPPVLVTFGGDGTVIATDGAGATGHGTWTATGERTAQYSYLTLGADGTVEHGVQYVGQAEVDAAGDTWTLPGPMPSEGGPPQGVRISDGVAEEDGPAPSVEVTEEAIPTMEGQPTEAP